MSEDLLAQLTQATRQKQINIERLARGEDPERIRAELVPPPSAEAPAPRVDVAPPTPAPAPVKRPSARAVDVVPSLPRKPEDRRTPKQRELRAGTRNEPYVCARDGRVTQRWGATISDEVAERERRATVLLRGRWNRVRFLEHALLSTIALWEKNGWFENPPDPEELAREEG